MVALMANWAWPHTPASYLSRVLLAGGPFPGEQVGFLPPDTPPPAQVAWAGFFPWGFATYLYEWTGETTMDQGRTEALVYRCTGRVLTAEEIPPLIADCADLWADTNAGIAELMGLPPEAIWPGL